MEATIPPHEREAMMEWHALPPGWWALSYEDFLKERRVRMARVVRKGYQRLCGELPVPAAPSEVARVCLWSCNRDAWFQSQGFTTCYSFADAADFFGISWKEAVWAFSGQAWLVSPQDVIKHIDALLAKHAISNEEANRRGVRRSFPVQSPAL